MTTNSGFGDEITVHNNMYVPLWGFEVIRSLCFKIGSVTVDCDGAGRQNHSLRSFILAPIPTTSHTRMVVRKRFLKDDTTRI